MRFLIRPAHFKDKEGLFQLARHFPLSSLPPDKSLLEKKIQTSRKSFNRSLSLGNRNYIFVMEDRQKKRLIASSQILSYFGRRRPLCHFLERDKSLLKLKRAKTGRNQTGGLILDPDYRQSPKSLGLQISLARFLYIKTFPKEFSPLIEVSLTAPAGKNYFWRETGQKNLKISYAQALKSWSSDRERFLSLFPKGSKISLSSLSEKAKAQLGQAHPQSLPVYKGLLKRGFGKTSRFHILDGGPYLEARWQALPFLKKAKSGFLKKDKSAKALSRFFVSQQNERGFFCALVLARSQKRNLLVKSFPKEFEEGKKILALKL